MSRSRILTVAVSPMRPMHIHKFGALDRWLASTEMKTSPELFMRSPLPDSDAMCKIYISNHLGFNGQNYLLSLAVYHPRVAFDHATPDIELARFVGYADDPGAPIWVHRLPPRKLLRFPQPIHFIGKMLEGMTDIPLGPLLWNGPDEQLRLERQLCFDNWVRDALAVRVFPDHTWLKLIVPRWPPLLSSPLCRSKVEPSLRKPLVVSIEEQAVAPALNETVNVETATAVKTAAFPVDMQTEALAADKHTTKIADVSVETDSGEQARQVHTEMIALWKLQKVTGILLEWKRRQETDTLLYGQSDRRIFVTRRRHRFQLQDYVGDYMRITAGFALVASLHNTSNCSSSPDIFFLTGITSSLHPMNRRRGNSGIFFDLPQRRPPQPPQPPYVPPTRLRTTNPIPRMLARPFRPSSPSPTSDDSSGDDSGGDDDDDDREVQILDVGDNEHNIELLDVDTVIAESVAMAGPSNLDVVLLNSPVKPSKDSQLRVKYLDRYSLVRPPFEEKVLHDRRAKMVIRYFEEAPRMGVDSTAEQKALFRRVAGDTRDNPNWAAEENCVFCLNNSPRPEILLSCPCRHSLFHQNCIQEWHRKKDKECQRLLTCLTCRSDAKPVHLAWVAPSESEAYTRKGKKHRNKHKKDRERRKAEKHAGAAAKRKAMKDAMKKGMDVNDTPTRVETFKTYGSLTATSSFKLPVRSPLKTIECIVFFLLSAPFPRSPAETTVASDRPIALFGRYLRTPVTSSTFFRHRTRRRDRLLVTSAGHSTAAQGSSTSEKKKKKQKKMKLQYAPAGTSVSTPAPAASHSPPTIASPSVQNPAPAPSGPSLNFLTPFIDLKIVDPLTRAFGPASVASGRVAAVAKMTANIAQSASSIIYFLSHEAVTSKELDELWNTLTAVDKQQTGPRSKKAKKQTTATPDTVADAKTSSVYGVISDSFVRNFPESNSFTLLDKAGDSFGCKYMIQTYSDNQRIWDKARPFHYVRIVNDPGLKSKAKSNIKQSLPAPYGRRETGAVYFGRKGRKRGQAENGGVSTVCGWRELAGTCHLKADSIRTQETGAVYFGRKGRNVVKLKMEASAPSAAGGSLRDLTKMRRSSSAKPE
ncbi:hypothetical protein B0H19DRAFT_1083705 [Mycena capillaripes]|nr:hypothetical protein B0H19DRAFT_1083705 [Mycena capillaripes]